MTTSAVVATDEHTAVLVSTWGPLTWTRAGTSNALRAVRELTDAQRVALRRAACGNGRVWAARKSTEDALHIRGIVRLDARSGWGGCRGEFRLTDHGRRVVALLSAQDRTLRRGYWHAEDYPPDSAIVAIESEARAGASR